MRTTAQHAIAATLALGLAAGITGCDSGGRAPVIESVDDQTGVVGQELVINLRATDADGDEIDFDFSAPAVEIQDVATLTRRPDGTAVFRWTPLAADVGTWFFDFHADDDDGRSTVTVVVDVTATGGEASAPIFREPLGSGTTLDLATAACLDVPVVVDDPDDAEVMLFTASAELEGAMMSQETGLSAMWRWCPSKAQLEDERYPITFAASDGDHEPTLKNFLVVLRSAPKADCPGEAPQVVHAPRDVQTRLDLEVVADITDDTGLAREPLLYFTFEEPKFPLDFATLDVVEMALSSGDGRDGSWTGVIPNPVAAGADGDTASVYYIISAKDNDDAEGDCDHLTDAPLDGTYSMTVTHGGGETGAACDACSADLQCGGDSDLCAPLSGDEVCLLACGDGDACGDGTTCTEVTSVDGITAKQCVPDTGTCGEPKVECTDDDQEDNDSQAEASPLALGDHDLVSCGGEDADDEDWFAIEVAEGSLTVELQGGGATNLQLGLFDADGESVAISEGASSEEVIHECLAAGTYYARVHTFDTGANDYTLSVSHVAVECSTPACSDDDLEDDDSQEEATYAEVYPEPFEAIDRMICSEDDDFYRLELFTNETVVIDLNFTQSNNDEDLDLHFFDSDGVDVTPCTEASPGTCSAAQGQSVTSNEHYEYTVDTADCTPCSFWVSVHGWDGAENGYDLQMMLQP